MRQKLQIDPKASSLEEFQNAWETPPAWVSDHKLGILEGVCFDPIANVDRASYATANGISARTLQRWIHQLNEGGLSGALEPVQCGPGRKRKIGLLEVRDSIVPMAQEAVKKAGLPGTMKNLYLAARNLGLLEVSYATFRRRLHQTGSTYKRRKIEPTIEEWHYHANTGRWPSRLKAFGLRRAKMEQEYWRRYREKNGTAA